jgi:hypothetical protein
MASRNHASFAKLAGNSKMSAGIWRLGFTPATKDVFALGRYERVPVRSFYSALEHWHILLTELAGR